MLKIKSLINTINILFDVVSRNFGQYECWAYNFDGYRNLHLDNIVGKLVKRKITVLIEI